MRVRDAVKVVQEIADVLGDAFIYDGGRLGNRPALYMSKNDLEALRVVIKMSRLLMRINREANRDCLCDESYIKIVTLLEEHANGR